MLTRHHSRLVLLCLVGVLGHHAGNCDSGKGKGAGIRASANFKFKDRTAGLFQDPPCDLDPDLVAEIAGYQSTADIIIHALTQPDGLGYGRTYEKTAQLVDKFPIRLSGTPELEDSIDYMMEQMRGEGLDHVYGEQVLVPHWVRGEEEATMISPVKKNLALLGLGTSVGTPNEGITAPVLVVHSFEELDRSPEAVKGKIVVYNQGWLGNYGDTNLYRRNGAARAARHGAVATLIQSVAPFSLNTPHTGSQYYQEGVPRIPAACITMEDADYLSRLQSKQEKIVITLRMMHYNLPLTTSRNVIGEITGALHPDQYVGVSGHIDSWDVGQGVMDDAGGVMISTAALATIKALNLPRPKRTLRAILWTSEEPGLWGVKDYVRQHDSELGNWSAVFESDSGTFKPRGLDFAGTPQAGCIIQEVLKLTSSINATEYARYDSVSSDISEMIKKGVPGLSLNNENDHYFWYHHTEADTITMADSHDLDLGAALWTIASYVLADLSIPLPRNVTFPQ